MGGLTSRVGNHCSAASAILQPIRTAISCGALCGGDIPPFLVEVRSSAECPSKWSFPCSARKGFIWSNVKC